MRRLPLDPVRVPPMSDPAASARRPVVLLASAHEWASRSLHSILTPNGYRVLHAYAGYDALLQVRAAQPDVLMIDLQLPGIDGVALCRMLRADPSVTASTAIIATTASPVGRQQRLEVLRAGGSDPLGRTGPGEFAIVAAGAGAPVAAGLGRRLAQAVQAAMSQKRPGPLRLRIGYGTATASRAADLDLPALLAQARGGLQDAWVVS